MYVCVCVVIFVGSVVSVVCIKLIYLATAETASIAERFVALLDYSNVCACYTHVT